MKLDTSKTPAWDLTLTIRGVDVPTLSPLTAAERSVVNLGERRRGVAVRLWRWLVGDPQRVVADDHETLQLRHLVAAFTIRLGADGHPERGQDRVVRLIESLSGGELLTALHTYVGVQQAWALEISREARRAADAAWASLGGGRAASSTGAAEPTVEQVAPGVKRYSVPPTPLVPGQFPDWAKSMLDGAEAKG